MVALHDGFQFGSPLSKRDRSQVSAFEIQAIERHVDRRGRGDVFGSFAEPLEAGDELVMEDRHLAVGAGPDRQHGGKT